MQIFIFKLLCGASKGFMKAFKALIFSPPPGSGRERLKKNLQQIPRRHKDICNIRAGNYCCKDILDTSVDPARLHHWYLFNYEMVIITDF